MILAAMLTTPEGVWSNLLQAMVLVETGRLCFSMLTSGEEALSVLQARLVR